ncbi:MAG: dihydrofolate reductase [bacterium]
MRITFVVAIAANGMIGKGRGLPWPKLSNDLKFFKRTTLGKPIVMGRKTYETIGKPLPGRANIVLTRNPGFQAEGVHVAHSVDDAIALAEKIARADGAEELAIIGGAELYAHTFARADRLYVTEIHAEFDGDTRFPQWDRAAWNEVSRDEQPGDPAVPFDYAFVTYDRR